MFGLSSALLCHGVVRCLIATFYLYEGDLINQIYQIMIVSMLKN